MSAISLSLGFNGFCCIDKTDFSHSASKRKIFQVYSQNNMNSNKECEKVFHLENVRAENAYFFQTPKTFASRKISLQFKSSISVTVVIPMSKWSVHLYGAGGLFKHFMRYFVENRTRQFQSEKKLLATRSRFKSWTFQMMKIIFYRFYIYNIVSLL